MSSQESRCEDRPEDARQTEVAQAQHTPGGSPSAQAPPADEELPPLSFGFGCDESEEAASSGRRGKDCFAPPAEPCECYCLHCGRTFMSDRIWFQKVINDPQGFEGFWMCPTPNCSGAGFTFDLFPTDPTHPANEGWHYDDDEESDSEYDPAAWDESAIEPQAEEETEYDPDEPKYKELDAIFGEEDEDDLEGEEWKYGLQPGERPPSPGEESLRQWEEEQRSYDEPDQRPQVLDWSNREDRKPENNGGFSEEDIPF